MKTIDLTNRRFGRLVALHVAEKTSTKRHWKCLCDCGNYTFPDVNSLTSGRTISCGCKRRQGRPITHGGANTVEYRIWAGMNRRCHNQNDYAYKYYGARGISVCDAWRHDFAAFFRDMGPRPTDSHSIDRRDVNGNYCRENCRWATDLEQASNKTDSRLLTLNGETKTLTAWARDIGIRHASLRERLDSGMSVEDALTVPKRKNAIYSFQGKEMTARQWAAHLGFAYSTMIDRLQNLPLEVALSRPREKSKIYTLNGVSKTAHEWAKHIGVSNSTMHERLRTMPIEKALSPRKI